MTVFVGPVIQIPECPGPIFNPIKGLADALQVRRVSVAPVLHIEGGGKMHHPGVHQFSCTGQEDFPELAGQISEVGKVVRFLTLFVPKSGVVAAQTYSFGGIWARYIAAYGPALDESFGRWDVMVEAVDTPEKLKGAV